MTSNSTADIENKTKCIDDTLLWSNNIEKNFHLTCKFLTRCGQNGITLNPKKFQFAKDEVEFAGFTITPDSVKPCERYLQAIQSFPTPKDITGIRSWFGLVNQVSYAFSMTERMSPFRELLKPGRKFYWDENLDMIFEESKTKITNEVKNGVQLFDSSRKTCLSTDWSKTGTGFYLTQKHCNCTSESPNCCSTGWKVIFAGSKFNNKAETNYAPIEGECLAVVKALHRSRYFVLGCKDLTLATDHKPLIKILSDRCLEDIHNPRLLKLKEKTLLYRFKITYVPGNSNNVADATSRYPVENTSKMCSYIENICIDYPSSQPDTENYTHGLVTASLSGIDDLKSVTWERVREATLNDPAMMDLLHAVQDGLNPGSDGFPSHLRDYNKHWIHLSTVDTVVLYKERVVIPPSLRQEVLENLHSAHQGIRSMTARADASVFWPGIHPAITQLRLRCSACNKISPSQPNAPPEPLLYPEYPFQCLCADYFSYGGENYLVIVDRYSNWPVVMKAKYGDGCKQLIDVLKAHCATFGIPEELASDGASQFTSADTRKFMND